MPFRERKPGGVFSRPLAVFVDRDSARTFGVRANADVAPMQDQPVMGVTAISVRHDFLQSQFNLEWILAGRRLHAGCRSGIDAYRPQSSLRQTRYSARRWQSSVPRPAALQVPHGCAALCSRCSRDQFLRQRNDVLRLGAIEPDGLDPGRARALRRAPTIFSGVSAAANSAGVALLTPASVACADSTTATSSVNGLTWLSSPFGSGLASWKRRKASSISASLQRIARSADLCGGGFLAGDFFLPAACFLDGFTAVFWGSPLFESSCAPSSSYTERR